MAGLEGRWLVVGLLAGQVADTLTMRLTSEANPLVVGLGQGAYVAKGAEIVLALAVAYLLGLPGDPRFTRLRRIRATAARGLLVFGTVYGLFGAWTNVA